MMQSLLRTAKAVAFSSLVLGAGASAQDLPTATEVAAQMTFGWNIGNTMEVPGDPTLWGNQVPTEALIDSVAASGINSIRIPCAWNSHADQSTYVIDTDWMNTVKTVVDYAIANGMYVILNSHWDEGWLEDNVGETVTADILARQKAYWGQIAETFKGYDEHLLFAGANEPGINDEGNFTATRMDVLNQYYQGFIDTVRATGGNNASRTLIVQGPRTDIELTDSLMTTMPTDVIANRLMAEVHFYPYQFTLMDEAQVWWINTQVTPNDTLWGYPFYYWGEGNHSTTDTNHNPTWGEEQYVDSLFTKMKSKFVDNGIPVIVGEFGAILRTNLNGDDFFRHQASRKAFYQYVSSSAKAHGMIPFAWDTGSDGNGRMSIFKRTGEVMDIDLLNGLRAGWGMTEFPGTTFMEGNNALKLVQGSDSTWAQANLGVLAKDFSSYDEIIVRAYVKGSSEYDSAGATQYGYVNLSLVTMSDGWTWKEASLGQLTFDAWTNYTVSLDASVTGSLVPADPTAVDFFALQSYAKGFHGSIYVDYIVFARNSGVNDTLYHFNQTGVNSIGGGMVAKDLIPVADVPADNDWETLTSKLVITTVEEPPVNDGVGKALKLMQDSDSTWGQADLGVVQANISNYDEILVRAFVKGATDYDSAGTPQYGFASLSLVTMSDNYTWKEANLGDLTYDAWKDYTIPLNSSATGALVPADPTALQFFALQSYTKGYHGAIYIDYIVFIDNEGSSDTLYTFDQTGAASFGGGVISSSLIPVADVAADNDWQTLTSKLSIGNTTPLLKAGSFSSQLLQVNNGNIIASVNLEKVAPVTISLRNLKGQTLDQVQLNAHPGENTVSLQTAQQGIAIVQIDVAGEVSNHLIALD